MRVNKAKGSHWIKQIGDPTKNRGEVKAQDKGCTSGSVMSPTGSRGREFPERSFLENSGTVTMSEVF